MDLRAAPSFCSLLPWFYFSWGLLFFASSAPPSFLFFSPKTHATLASPSLCPTAHNTHTHRNIHKRCPRR